MLSLGNHLGYVLFSSLLGKNITLLGTSSAALGDPDDISSAAGSGSVEYPRACLAVKNSFRLNSGCLLACLVM